MNADEFKRTFLPCTRRLYWAACRLTGNSPDADDLVQETLLRLWMKRGELGNVRSAEAYGIITLRRIYYDKRRLRHLGIAELNADITDESTPHSDCEREERARMVREQIDSLPEQQRELVTLRDMCELTYDEIATQTGLTLTNIRTTISRARKTLKTILTEKMR